MKMMKTLSSLAFVGALSLGLGGCATGNWFSSTGTENDYAKVAAIEHVATHQGVRVIWINYPQKKVSTSPAQIPGS
jgi:outer membrane lipoprotein SlyB